MIFSIDFNHHTLNGDKILEELGAVAKWSNGNEEFLGYFIELNDFKDLHELMVKLNKITNRTGSNYYSAIVDVDSVSSFIYFDDKV